MIKFLINKVNETNNNDIVKQVQTDETIIITSSSKVVEYKKFFNNYSNIRVVDLKTLIYQIYQNNINELPILNKEKQILFFIKAIKEAKSDLNYLSNHSFDMIDDLINIYQNETNYLLVKNTYQTNLIQDIELIINKYKVTINNQYIDEQMLYKEVLEFLKNNKIYNNTNIVISDIYYFNNIKKELVKTIITNSKNGYLYFLTDKEIPGFEIHSDSFNYFKNSFKGNYELEQLSNNSNAEKDFIVNNLYRLDYEVYPKSDYINLYGASDLYDEVIFVANQISNLVREKGYRYSDFAIVSNSITDYENYFDLIFNDNNISYHKKANINHNFFDYILRLLDIINEGISKTNLINILKTKYYKLTNNQLNQVMEVIDSNEKLNLEELDSGLRSYIFDNILKPLNIKENINATELLTLIYNYLETFNIPQLINQNNRDTWVSFVKILDNISFVYNDEPISISDLKDALTYFFNNVNVQDYYLDEVLVGDTTIINSLKPKVVFFIGVNEGVVPNREANNILLNKTMLEKYYQNYPKFNNILIDKFNTFYTIICPNDKIFITYYKISKNGSKTNPAPLINKIKSMYKELTVYTKENLNNSVSLRSLTYNHYLTNVNMELKNYLKTYFANHPDYQKYNKLIAYTPSFYDVDNVNLNDIKQLSLSPSSMDIYNYCPFQYFCKYILKLDKKESFKYDNRIVGTYIHYMFQNLISNCATKDNIMGLLNFWKQEFIKQENINLTATINYLFDKLNNSILKLWPLVYDEINNNKFEPSELELNLSTSANFPPVVLNYKNIPIYLRGFIDRVDLYNNYVRVIDYKTGSKVINLNDIAHKLNLQLFIYLLFIKHSKPDLLPAAMFYMPSLVKYEEAEFNPQHYRLTGMLIDNKDVIDGLGGENINTYIDAYTRQKFKDTVLISEQEMDEMLKFTEKATIKTASNIIDGHISISPLKGKDLCKYCHYQAICGIEEGSQNYRKFKKYSKEEIWELIRGEINEMD